MVIVEIYCGGYGMLLGRLKWSISVKNVEGYVRLVLTITERGIICYHEEYQQMMYFLIQNKILLQTLDRTMCEETVFWDLNYAMKYKSLVSENILAKVLKVIDNN